MKIKEKLKKWKKEITIGAGVIGAGIVGVVLSKKIPIWKSMPYATKINFSSEATRDAYNAYFDAGGGYCEGGRICAGVKSETIMKEISEVFANESEDRRYRFAIEKMVKKP